MNALTKLFYVVVMTLLFSTSAFAASYEIDKNHSTLGFAVKHLMVSTVRGGFTDYKGAITFDPNDLPSFQAEVTIQVDSIYTQLVERDKHLKGADFFNAKNHPTITFRSRQLAKTDNGYTITGDLTIRETTKQVTIPVTVTGPVKSPNGGEVMGIEGELLINRQDYGVSWNKVADNGAIASNEVKIIIEVEASKE